ncbi:alpha/beta hydrolase [Mycolicibacterium moriokaense]|uniref:Serine aminopeptidase S33 family n=1 Tax=Mycolicibacterium moriokaense TaxID=39691 RepID=A0A318H5A3_9MYCO|nr:alpha/beta hydrolase [Mycolicibacterium moriokaense]PXW99124.1 serine aminopeptidase S33 family [Mycolicibacterium moriokaense]
MRRLAAVAACLMLAIALCCSTAGCTHHDTDYSLELDDIEVGGPGTAGLSVVGQPVKGIVVYFHGSDQNARVIRDSERHRNLFDPLLRGGLAVVAADAGGDAYGNLASRQDYRRLIAAARAKYGQVPLFFVAESMGALAALALINEDTQRDVKAMVGITALMGLPPDIRTVSFIEGPWKGTVPSDADPLSWPPEAFAGRSFRLYASPDDKIIPPSASATAFANRLGSVATVEVVECAGGHVASACYQGSDVATWFAGLG